MTSFNTNSLGLTVLVGANSRISTNYTFRASGQRLEIHDADFKNLLFVENRESAKILYQILKPELGGKFANGGYDLNADTSGMNNTDDLLVIYESKGDELNNLYLKTLLAKLLKQSELTNMYLAEFLGDKFYKEDI